MPGGREDDGRIAVIGMAGRFPGADSVDELWDLLVEGRSGLRRLTAAELAAAGVTASHTGEASYVPVKGVLDGADLFDAAAFGFSPAEAGVLDPQQRVLLECTWHALEDAGVDPSSADGRGGVYAGSHLSAYLFHLLLTAPEVLDAVGGATVFNGNQPDQLATRVAHELDLRGPAVTVQTACSTALVAVHLACQALLAHEIDYALAAAVTVTVPLASGYHYEPGGILSPSGRCRPFDAEADGTVFGDGVGAVVLRRLADAVAHGDRVRAVVVGTAVNNDGADKVGFAAPSVNGQVEVLAEALEAADLRPGDVDYVETHGTGTRVGDPIELEALARVYGRGRERPCVLGATKANLGHLDVAAGMAGLIRAVCSLEREAIPGHPALDQLSPELRLHADAFTVPTATVPWPRSDRPRRAGVSAFGVGGTNAHVVVEEAPRRGAAAAVEDDQHVLALSAHDEAALAALTARVAAHVERLDGPGVADVAHLLRSGRRSLRYRRVVVAQDGADARDALTARRSSVVVTGDARSRPSVALVFPGQGALRPGVARAVPAAAAPFWRALDDTLALLDSTTAASVRAALLGHDDIGGTETQQVALFAFQHATAAALEAIAGPPDAVIGHSLGEYAAARVAGVFDLCTAVELVASRARLMASAAAGAMLAVAVSDEEAQKWCTDGIVAAAFNGPRSTVLSGAPDAISALSLQLADAGVASRRLAVDRAYHSPAMADLAEPFARVLAGARLSMPTVPMVSTRTGDWAGEELADPAYWVAQMLEPVRFADACRSLGASADILAVDVGPGADAAAGLRSSLPEGTRRPVALAPGDGDGRPTGFLLGVAALWAAGRDVDWEAAGCPRRRVVNAPPYPFTRNRHWLPVRPVAAMAPVRAPVPTEPDATRPDGAAVSDADIAALVWSRIPARPRVIDADERLIWLLLVPDHEAAQPYIDALRRRGQLVATAVPASTFARTGRGRYELHPADTAQYAELFADLRARVLTPNVVVHAWSLGAHIEPGDRSLRSFAALVQGLQQVHAVQPVRIGVVTAGAFDVTGDEDLDPTQALAVGPALVLPQEVPTIRAVHVDLDRRSVAAMTPDTAEAVLAEAVAGTENLVAFRHGARWRRRTESLPRDGLPTVCSRWVITGGFGGIGLALAEHLVERHGARVALLGRRPVPGGVAELGDLTDAEAADLGATPTTTDALCRLATRAAGPDILVAEADVCDETALVAALDAVRDRFGGIDGVIHAAGAPPSGIAVADAGFDGGAILASKVAGTAALLRHVDPSCRAVLCSSTTAVLGGYGQADYAAANAHLDAVAAAAQRAGRPVQSVAWDTWSETGMAVAASAGSSMTARLVEGGLRTADAVAAFDRCLASGAPHLLVTRPGGADAYLAGLALTSVAHPRPDVGTPYSPPANEVEELLAGVWAEVLGLEAVGVDDSFFDLGGHSLLAAQITARIGALLGIDITVALLFERESVRELAIDVEEALLDLVDSPDAAGGAPVGT